MNAADLELIKTFYLESGEILERLEADLRQLEATPEDDEVLNSVFRGLHTIKGNSSFLSLDNVTRLAHAAETMLEKARRKEIRITHELVAVVRNVFEDLYCLIVNQEAIDTSRTINLLQSFSSGKPAPIFVPSAPALEMNEQPKIATSKFVRVDETKLTKIISIVSELELLRYTLEKVPERMDALGRPAADLRFDVDLQVSRLSHLTRTLSGLVFGVRLVPVNQVFQRFPKVVKDLAGKLNKEIELEILKGDAELDKNIVEAIADPITHLLRNAADHGIESPADRAIVGKPSVGKIQLNSYVRGKFVFIEISDDGRGIDGDKVLRKAVEKGIVPESKAKGFTEQQKLSLIFAPGFSTAERVTDISGRGVGMDVVKNNINRLKGSVIIKSEVGKGTVIQLRFPLSVVMLFSLFVEVNDTCCAFPVELLNESMDYGPSELLSSLPSGVKTDEYVGLYSLRSVLWGQEPEFNDRNVFHLLRFKGEKGKSMAFVVDEYSSLEEAIVQSVDSYIATLPGIQGATVRKDGSVGLVLNPEKIIEQASRSRPFAFVKLKERDDSKDGNFTDYLKIAKAS